MKKNSKRLLLRPLLSAICIATLASHSHAQENRPPKWGSHIDLEGKAGTDRSLGETDLFVPLLQNDDTMLFTNLRARLDDSNSKEGNFGLGVRHMFESGWNVGGIAYFDRRKTEWDNYFNQVTLGLEALSTDWDIRGNAYLPQGRQLHSVDTLNDVSISGTSISFQAGEERSMSGFDAEIGWRLPVNKPEEPQQIRLFAGGYHFSADNVDDVTGPRFRGELTFDEVSWLWTGSRFSLGSEWQHDDPRGSQGFITARLRIPLQFFGRTASRLTPMERRMTDPVIRDIDIVSQSGAFGAPETVTETADGQAITVLDSKTTTGAGLAAAVAAAGNNSTVILSGNYSTGTTTTTLQSGQTLMGTGTLNIRSPSGKTATLTTPGATISGTPTGANGTITMANNSTLTGMTVSDSDTTDNAIGIGIVSVDGAKLINNTITSNQTGVGGVSAHAIRVLNSTNITISGNTLTSRTASNISSTLNITNSSVKITDNTLDATAAAAGTVAHTLMSTADIQSGSSGNTVKNGDCVVNSVGTGGVVSYTNAANCGP
ncbi:inverse autotransporter beta domain-containing protein [Thalassospira lucentensis]|uniref:inverse autotransporter beta domain-containing protein n=1 Tax=Thalassospira lucentensis TaxID=168935 RepID=UPI00399D7291